MSKNRLFQWKMGLAMLLVCLSIPAASLAAWLPDGNPVCTNAGVQEAVHTIHNADGSSIIVWLDYRNVYSDIYAQKLDAQGNPMWTDGGVVVCDEASYQYGIDAASDGDGGVVVAWYDGRNGYNNYDIFAQRLNSNGVVQWAANGHDVCTASLNQRYPRVVIGNGAVFVAWQDGRDDGHVDLYVQKMNWDDGGRNWGANQNGIEVEPNTESAETTLQYSIAASPYSGAAIIVTYTANSGYYTPHGEVIILYAQQFNFNGEAMWAENPTYSGHYLSNPNFDHDSPSIVVDNSNHAAYICYHYYDDDSGTEQIGAARINSNGGTSSPGWIKTLPVPSRGLCKTSRSLSSPCIAFDGYGNVVVTWQDVCDGQSDIYAQKLTIGLGTPCWGSGYAVCEAAGAQYNPQIVQGGFDRVILSWTDERNGSTNKDIYAQVLKTSTDGDPQCLLAEDGAVICAAASNQERAVLSHDGAGNASIVWMDKRSGELDIYATRLYAPPRQCTVQIPNGGERWPIGSTKDITIQVESIAAPYTTGLTISSYELGVSYDGGETYISQPHGPVTSEGDSIRKIPWEVNGSPSQDCRVDAVTVYPDNIRGEDASDAFFEIYETGTAWPNDAAIAVFAYNQTNPHIVYSPYASSDYYIVTWEDNKGSNGVHYDIYAQRIDESGVSQWTTPKVIVNASYDQIQHQTAPDGSGGSIIVWKDKRIDLTNGNIYAQRIDAAGLVKWTANGVLICGATLKQEFPVIAADGSGGAIMAWEDNRNHSTYDDLFVQKVDANGNVKWTANGINIYDGSDKHELKIVHDGLGGAYITFIQGSGSSERAYLSWINSTGTSVQTISLSTAAYRQRHPELIYAGTDDVIVVWQEYRPSPYTDIYANKIHRSGTTLSRLWAASGQPICDTSALQYSPKIAPAGDGGAIIAWHDNRDGNYNIYAQRINSSGAGVWTEDGIPAGQAAGDQAYAEIVAGGNGSSIISWTDMIPNSVDALYAQKLDGNGAPQFATNGIMVTASLFFADADYINHQIAADGSGGAVFAWRDLRGLNPEDIYAQRVAGEMLATALVTASNGDEKQAEAMKSDAGTAATPFVDRLGDNYPNPFNPTTTIDYSISKDGPVSINIYNVNGQLVRTLVNEFKPKGQYSVVWNGKHEHGTSVTSGMYFYRMQTAGFVKTKKLVLLR
jgi:hypothetical protein